MSLASPRRAHVGRLSLPRPGGRGLVCIIAAAALLALAACSKAPHASDAPAGVLRLSQRNEPADLDPATATLPDEFFVIRALGEGLLNPTPDGRGTRPGIAERFEVSPDGLTYTFHLRENLTWSSGEPLTADDVVASFRRVLEPATAAPKAHLFFAVKNARAYATGALRRFSDVGLRAVGFFTVVITLEHPSPLFPLYVASGPWIPVNPRVVDTFGRTWTQPEHHVGNGPYILAEWRPQQRIIVTPNPRYRDPSPTRPRAIHFLRVDSEDTEERAYRAGQLDVTLAVPRTKLPVYARERPAELHRLPLAETRFLSFNTQRPPLDDARVRRALSLAIDRRQLIDRVLLAGQRSADRFLSPVLAHGLAAPATSAATHDADAARRFLAEAGFAGGKNFPHLELTAWSPSQAPVLEAIQAMWRDALGIEVGVALREAKVHLAALSAATYDIAFVTTLLDVADPVAALGDFAAAAPNNFPHWRSAAFDDLLARAAAPDAATQAALLTRAEALLLDEAAVAPLYFNVQAWLMAPRVHGWRQDPLWQRDYTALSLDDH